MKSLFAVIDEKNDEGYDLQRIITVTEDRIFAEKMARAHDAKVKVITDITDDTQGKVPFRVAVYHSGKCRIVGVHPQDQSRIIKCLRGRVERNVSPHRKGGNWAWQAFVLADTAEDAKYLAIEAVFGEGAVARMEELAEKYGIDENLGGSYRGNWDESKLLKPDCCEDCQFYGEWKVCTEEECRTCTHGTDGTPGGCKCLTVKNGEVCPWKKEK